MYATYIDAISAGGKQVIKKIEIGIWLGNIYRGGIEANSDGGESSTIQFHYKPSRMVYGKYLHNGLLLSWPFVMYSNIPRY